MSITLVRTRPCQFLFSMSVSRRDCDRSYSRLSRDMTSKQDEREKPRKYIKWLENPRLCPKSDKYTFDRSLCIVSIWTFLGYILHPLVLTSFIKTSFISVQVIWKHFITIIYLIRDIFSSFYTHRHLIHRQVTRLRTIEATLLTFTCCFTWLETFLQAQLSIYRVFLEKNDNRWVMIPLLFNKVRRFGYTETNMLFLHRTEAWKHQILSFYVKQVLRDLLALVSHAVRKLSYSGMISVSVLIFSFRCKPSVILLNVERNAANVNWNLRRSRKTTKRSRSKEQSAMVVTDSWWKFPGIQRVSIRRQTLKWTEQLQI